MTFERSGHDELLAVVVVVVMSEKGSLMVVRLALAAAPLE